MTATGEGAYLIDLSACTKPGAATVSDIRLAVHRDHSRKSGQTVLMTKSIDGDAYALMLCGHVEGSYQQDGEVQYFENGTTPAWVVAQLEKSANERSTHIDMDHGPWFEWVAPDGSPVGDAFDGISLDPAVEVGKLQQMLGEKRGMAWKN